MFRPLLAASLNRAGHLYRRLGNGPEVNTTLAFVHLQGDGERSFSFYRSPGADIRLKPEEIQEAMFEGRIFHFGSLSLPTSQREVPL